VVIEISVKYPGGPLELGGLMCVFLLLSLQMKGKISSAELLDKTIWNPRPVIDLLSRAITELGGSFLLVLGPTFSSLLTNKSLLTNAVLLRQGPVTSSVGRH
jgi:hypothetical protein